MSALVEVSAKVLERRSLKDIQALDTQAERLDQQLNATTARLVEVAADRQALEALFQIGKESDKLLLPIAHELAEVKQDENRLRGKREKLERELLDVRQKAARWRAIRAVLGVK